ncbi:MAG: alpha-glucuronidase [Bacteroides sp.]|nr:alpha-glucuronidase [Bacteroides sp.]
MNIRTTLLLPLLLCCCLTAKAEEGSRLWLRQATGAEAQVTAPRGGATLQTATHELREAWKGQPITLRLKKDKFLGSEGFRITPLADRLELTAATERGLLYGAYHLLRLQESNGGHAFTPQQEITEVPAYDLRILNHWDNIDGTVERGYAGSSLWDWESLPEQGSDRYEAYARANASIGINGTVLNNVNASPRILSRSYIEKVKALADVFRPYGLRVYLSVNFASPMALDSLPTADPADKAVARWWKNKVKEIYRLIPDFGGFLVKANSEGQPGPCDYGRTHAEGANMLADALAPHGGIVMWRAFVYSPGDADRAKQAYIEFKPLDGKFRKNVIVQVKNGPVDFQPREPYSPLFGAMQQTPLMAELQITQEYLGHANHVAYLAPMWKEFFQYVPPTSLRAIAGVSNIGNSPNWCGHPLAQSNWYAFGRLAWNPALSAEAIADEWLVQTFRSLERQETSGVDEQAAYKAMKQILMESREAVVNYMMPLGLHHLFAWGHHYGPEPWCDIPGARPDWMPSYYHKADKEGIGFDRSSRGSNAVAQYPDSLARLLDDAYSCPEQFLLWFHHLPWNHPMQSGNSLWEELCRHYSLGVREVRKFQQLWDRARPYIDEERFLLVQSLLKIQVRDAVWWKDACLLYFQELSGLPFPDEMERPIHTLPQLKQVKLGISNYECPDAELLDSQR